MDRMVHMWTCDRCGYSTDRGEGPYEPEGWEYINKHLLCSRCFNTYTHMFNRFVQGEQVSLNALKRRNK